MHEGRSYSTPVGDLNNTHAARAAVVFEPDLSYFNRTLAIPASEDDPQVRQAYRPFLLSPQVTNSDWVASLELSTIIKMAEQDLTRSGGDRLKVMVLYGSMRSR